MGKIIKFEMRAFIASLAASCAYAFGE